MTNRLEIVVFYPGSSGVMSSIVYEISELSRIGKISSEFGLTGSRLYTCTYEAQSEQLCTENELGTYLIDGDQPTKTIHQEKFNFGEGLDKNKVMVRALFLHQSYKVNTTGYYCVDVAPFVTVNDLAEMPDKLFRGHLEFVNRYRGQLPASEHPKLYVRSSMEC